MKYILNYDCIEFASVDIDEATATPFIREMVDFFSGGESRLEDAEGNYTTAFLKQLGSFILERRREPKNDDGWYPLDGSHGVKILSIFPWDFEECEIQIEVAA